MQQMTANAFKIETSWEEALKDELTKPYLHELVAFLKKEYSSDMQIYPPKHLIFNAFEQTPFDKVKVLIIGQDPYHGPDQAHGLCFSVNKGIRIPPSLLNIYKELNSDLGIPIPNHGCMLSWAQQGVMLLNATLTVQSGQPLSHFRKGWEEFTDAVVRKLAARKDPVIFVLWGRSAQMKLNCLQDPTVLSRHFVLKAAHPSPLSAHNGFLGCKHFSSINKQLSLLGKEPINWQIT